MKDFFSFRFKPEQDTAFALLSLLLFWVIALVHQTFIGAEISAAPLVLRLLDILHFVIWFMMGNIFLGVFFPVAYLSHDRGEKLEAMGFTTKGLLPALLVSVVLAAALVFGAFPSLFSGAYAAGLGRFLAVSALSFGVPFFVHGWLQTRFERAFGAIPGILLAAGSLGLIHLGSYPMGTIVILLVAGLVMALAFRLTRSLFAVWPVLSAIVAAATTVGDFEYGWGAVVGFLLMVMVQIMAFGWLNDHAVQARKAQAE
jgi:hypothetical protein